MVAHLRSANNVTSTPTVIAKHGKAFAPPHSGPYALLLLIPKNVPNSTVPSIVWSTTKGYFRDSDVARQGLSGYAWDPLFDWYRLTEGRALGVFVVNETTVQIIDS